MSYSANQKPLPTSADARHAASPKNAGICRLNASGGAPLKIRVAIAAAAATASRARRNRAGYAKARDFSPVMQRSFHASRHYGTEQPSTDVELRRVRGG